MTFEIPIPKPYLFTLFELCHCASNGIKLRPPWRYPDILELEILKYFILFICTGVQPVLAKCIVTSFFQHIKLYTENDETMHWQEMLLGENWSHAVSV